jgi:nucleoside-diphosphate-sugar epimerase
MKVLFIGGTGNISGECSLRALAKGMEVWHLNRGFTGRAGAEVPAGIKQLFADVRDEAAAEGALGRERFDAVVDFVAFTREHIEEDIRLFRDRARQFVFISSASAYRKPPVHHVITESTPLVNPYWEYSRNKIECERALEAEGLARGFPYTIVRPSHTYCSRWMPTAFGSADFTVPKRMLDGRRVIVHGDGQSLWTLTHARDFAVGLVGLLGNPAAIGEAVQITGDEALTWDAIHATIAGALGVEPKIVHIPSDFIARVDPERGAHFLGDKTYSALFDCSKLRRLVPEFRTTVSFHEGMAESAAWFMALPSRQRVDPALDASIDAVLAAWDRNAQEEGAARGPESDGLLGLLPE